MGPYLHELVPEGPAAYPHLELYWHEAGRMPYLLRVGDEDAGFALVRHHPEIAFHEMAEFYIRPAWRRRGIGAVAARALFARHPGWWHLQVLDSNHPARAFWQRVIPGTPRREQQMAPTGRRYCVLRFHVSTRWAAAARPTRAATAAAAHDGE